MNNEIEALKALLAEASERIAKLEAAEKVAPAPWPQDNDEYWLVYDEAAVVKSRWYSDGADQARMVMGNVFRTEAEAEQELERRKVLTELRKLAKESWGYSRPDWSNTRQGKWRLCYDHSCNIWRVVKNARQQNLGAVYFVSKEAAQAAIETIGADRRMLLLEG